MQLSDDEKKEITQNLAAAMGAEWKADISQFREYHINGTNYRRLRLDFYYGKVYAVLPENKHGSRYNHDHIGCTLTRESKALARDIKKRLLPGYPEAVERTRQERFEYLRTKTQSDLVIDAVSRFYPLRDNYHGGHSFDVNEAVSCRIERVRGKRVITLFGLSDEQLIKLVANIGNIV